MEVNNNLNNNNHAFGEGNQMKSKMAAPNLEMQRQLY
jgi:hypothetical protein